jgi:tRNA pseudouridine38-40 synthase
VRTIQRLDVTRSGEYLYLDVVANAFLHHMVRNIAGVLMAVGHGEREPGWVQDILEKRDRTQGGVTAPAAGLYLVGVRYPERYGIEPFGAVPEFR